MDSSPVAIVTTLGSPYTTESNCKRFLKSYIDGRGFASVEGLLVPGPIGYESIAFLSLNIIGYVAYIVNPLSQVSDVGLPFGCAYRCFVIHSTNYRVIVLPSLIYLASFGTCSGLLRANGGASRLVSLTQGRVSYGFTMQPVRMVTDFPPESPCHTL